jgi:hypothetical protein
MVTYLVSDVVDYEDYMPDDAGPRFAEMYNWQWTPLSECKFADRDVYVIDWYMTEDEFNKVSVAMREHPASLFCVHVVDPGPHVVGTPAYRFLLSHGNCRNIAISGPYLPAENIARLYARGLQRSVFTPYLYEGHRELIIDHSRRRNALILTGNTGLPDYPIRHSIKLHSRFNPLFWGRIRQLSHPGYQKSKLKHFNVGQNYIQALSQYRFAVVCSSRLRLEFLKYREIAYAGCVPVGDLPGTLMDCPVSAFVPWRRNFVKTRKLMTSCNSEDRAKCFRDFMAIAREKTQWRKIVNDRFDMYREFIR